MRMKDLILIDDVDLLVEQIKRHKTISFSTFNELRKEKCFIYLHIKIISAMPWFGLDIGGTLTKLVYFEPTDHVCLPFFNRLNDVKQIEIAG